MLVLRECFLFTCEFESQGLFSQAAGDNEGDGVLEEFFFFKYISLQFKVGKREKPGGEGL